MSGYSESDRPRRLALPRSRRLSIDVVHYHRQVPTCAHDRMCDLTLLARARELAPHRISWSLLFVKAFALVAAKHPELRQTLMPWPWTHLYQHPHSVGMVATHREFGGAPWLFWSRFPKPETLSLTRMQKGLERYQNEPVQKVFKKQWLLSSFPTPLRRLLWWWSLNVSGKTRAKRAGTFVLTTLGAHGAEIQHPPAFLTGNLTFGPIDRRNRCRVTLAYDHRVLDGRLVADCLAELEQALNGAIADELASLAARPAIDSEPLYEPNPIEPIPAIPRAERPNDPTTRRWRFDLKSALTLPNFLRWPRSRPLSGRNALITGGSAGIGLAVAKALAAEGMHVVIAARGRDALEAAAKQLQSRGGTAVAVPTDVTDSAQLQQLVETATREVGPIDVLVNNAGIETYREFDQLDPAEIERTIGVNLIAALQLTRLVIPQMLKQGRGQIVNMSSTAGKFGPAFGAAYGASKAGLIAFTQSLRSEYHGTGVSASTICPGFTHAGGMYERMKQETGSRTPWYVGATDADAVARAVVNAVRRDLPEVLVNSPPLRPTFVLTQMAPAIGAWIVRNTTRRFLQNLATARAAANRTGSSRAA